MRIAKQYDMEFIEVSSKDGTNIEALFNRLGTKVSQYVRNTQKSPAEDA